MEKFGIIVNAEVEKYGFYPVGVGIVNVEVVPVKSPRTLNLVNRGKLFDIKAFSIASEDLKSANVADRQLASFKKSLSADFNVKGFPNYVKTSSAGSCLYAHALYENCKLGASALGEKGKPAEKVGEECASELLKEIKSEATVDKHMADQLIPFLGLFGGSFATSEITNHTKTNIWLTEKFIGKKFGIKENKIWT